VWSNSPPFGVFFETPFPKFETGKNEYKLSSSTPKKKFFGGKTDELQSWYRRKYWGGKNDYDQTLQTLFKWLFSSGYRTLSNKSIPGQGI
jgi:hypothetical protein